MWFLFDYSRNSVNFLQAKELLKINQDTQSASSTKQPQFLPILSRRRGGPCTRLGPSIWDLRVAGCRFHDACYRYDCYDCERHQTPADCGISRNAGTSVCFFGLSNLSARRNRAWNCEIFVRAWRLYARVVRMIDNFFFLFYSFYIVWIDFIIAKHI